MLVLVFSFSLDIQLFFSKHKTKLKLILVVIGDKGSAFGISKGKYCFLVIGIDEYAYGMLSNKGLWRIVKPVFTLCTKRF